MGQRITPAESAPSGASTRRRGLRARGGTRALLAVLAVLASPAGARQTCEVVERCRSPLGPSTELCDSTGPAGTPFVRGVNCRFVEVDGFPREYIVYVPKDPGVGLDEPLPLVVMAHGSSGDGGKFLQISGWVEKAEEVGLVVVFPTALEVYSLDAGRCTTQWNKLGQENLIDLCTLPRQVRVANQTFIDYPLDAPWPADDVGFIDAVLEDAGAGLPLDPDRLFFTGFSNGAGFARRIALERSEVFAAAAWSGGGLGPLEAETPPARNLPLSVLLGECDEKLAAPLGFPAPDSACFSGTGDGIPTDPDAFLANPTAGDWLAALASAFGLDPATVETSRQSRSGSAEWSTPADTNDAGNGVTFTLLDGVGHEYPRCSELACNNPFRFSAADRFWQFFEATRPSSAPESVCPRDDERVLCLGRDGRFRLEVEWRTADGEGSGTAIPFTDDSGLFWFFSADNVELLVKVLDACALNGRFWVFAGASTDVGYTLRVTDTATGERAEYVNTLGVRSPAITDTDAFATCSAP
jgi:poly(3-hydroxybutyrate) depolymerase